MPVALAFALTGRFSPVLRVLLGYAGVVMLAGIAVTGSRAGWGAALVAVLVLLTSLLALIYIWRVVEAAYFRPLPDGRAPPQEAPLFLLVPTWTLALANLYFGIDTSFSVGVARQAAELLLPGTAS